ncbi:hypothetical protein [Streptomyces sp. MST-110588]|uniref:hypothetical protein n=1 Tax=Streptomyces sp. MST-110588 TaxID=2833628 RepID=UPI001F5DD562|nr:hypothetical protein [Streptomyces sp. MST-110588]UNO40365.1 hypothetical protein KGS77_13215 [Streptomyces sp. MST-110588]
MSWYAADPVLAGLPTLAEGAHAHGTQPGQPVLLRAAHLESFQMAGLGTPHLNRELPTLRSVLRFAPEGAGQDFLARLASKGLERNSTPAPSYTTAEFDRITTTARSQLR